MADLVSRRGVLTTAGAFLIGTIGLEQLGAAAGPEWEARFRTGSKLMARLLWVIPEAKAVGLSLASHLTACVAYEPPVELGTPRSRG